MTEKNSSCDSTMNMHHITKSLFVGVAIAGIGMSSGRAEIPLSGETRAWNATVKKLEPLFEGTGFKLDGDRLRRLITEYFFYNFRVHGVGPFSFKQFAEGVRPKDPKIADLKYSWSYCLGRCLAGYNMTVGDAQFPIQGKLKSCYEEGCNFNIGAMILVERKLILCPTYSEKEGVSFREAALRTKTPGYVDIKFVNGTTGDAFLLRTQFGYFFLTG